MSNTNGVTKQRTIQSMVPPQMLFGYTYHAMMVPPFPPRSMLVLGYGEGTVAHLTHRIWPLPIQIDAVDIAPSTKHATILTDDESVSLLQMDAERFVKGCSKIYDYVVVDLYVVDRIPKFVFSPDFVSDLRRITGRMLAVNCTYYLWDDFKSYNRYFNVDCVKQTNSDKVLFFEPTKIKLTEAPHDRR